MVKLDWKLFESKFSDNPQKYFEWFCYLLFCQEFNQPYGIPRIYNQPGIETFPISKDNEVIGWQAKFYSGKLGDHKDDIIDSIEKAKKYNPDLTKYILFCNLEWTPTKDGKYPNAKNEILDLCKSLNICFEERLLSYFEKIVEDKEYNNITSFFFTNVQESNLEIQRTVCKRPLLDILLYKENFEKKIDVNENTIISGNPLIDYFEQVFSMTDFEAVQNYYVKGIAGIGKSVELKKTYNYFVSKFSDINNYEKSKFIFVPYFFDLKDYNDDFFKIDNLIAPYILFLDGLDELSDEKILAVSKYLKNLKNSYKNIRFIIAGRDAAFFSQFLENEAVTELFLGYSVDDSLSNLIHQYKGSFFESLIQIPFYREFISTVQCKDICTYRQFFELFVDNQLCKDKQNSDSSKNISFRNREKSTINLDIVKAGLSELAAYLYEHDKRKFSESELKVYLNEDNYLFALKSSLFDYKSCDEIYFISNIFLEYFYARSLANVPYHKVKKQFFNSVGSIRISKLNILYILLNIISNKSKLYIKLTKQLRNFSHAYILLTDFITLSSEERVNSYWKIVNEFNSKKELIYYGRFHESNDMFANITSLADKMFELLPEDKQLKAITIHIQTIENFLNAPSKDKLNTFCNSVILLGFGEGRWNEKCQKLLKQISIPLLRFFLNHELANDIRGLLSSLVVFLWYKTYDWTEGWSTEQWIQFILDTGRNTSKDFYEFFDENDYKLKRTLFIHFNNNDDIWKLLIPLAVKSSLSDSISDHASHVPAILDDDFKTPVLHFDNDVFYFRNVIQSESARITVQNIIEIASQVSEKATHRLSQDYESRELVEVFGKQYFDKITQLTNKDVPILYSIIKNVLKESTGLYAHQLIRYIQILPDDLKLALYSQILIGIERKEINNNNFSLWQPMVYLLNIKERLTEAIKCLQKTKEISAACYKDIFFYCKRGNDNHACKEYCNEKYKSEFPDEYNKEVSFNKRKENYYIKIEEMRKKEIEFIQSPDKILLEVDRILDYLDSDKNPFNKDTERMDLIYLDPEQTLDYYDYGLNKDSKDPEVFSEFVIKILREASFNDEKKVNREHVKENIQSWGDLKQNFWRFFFWYYVRVYKSEKVKEFLNSHPEIVTKIKESMEMEFPEILDSQDITIFDGGKNMYQVVPFIYYLENLYGNKLPDYINPQNLLKLVAFPAWRLSEYGVHTTGDYKWGEFESVFEWLSIILKMDRRNVIDYAISIYPKVESDISKTQIISYFCDSVVNGTIQSEEALSLILQESIKECSHDYKPEENLNSMNYTLQNFWNKYDKNIIEEIEDYIDFNEYKNDEKNYCRKATADYIIKYSDSSKREQIISEIKRKTKFNELSDDNIYLLARLGDRKSTIKLIDEYLNGKELNTHLYLTEPLFGIENASNKTFKKIIQLYEYSLQKSNDRRQDLHSIAIGLINRNVTKKNFRILKKHLEIIIEEKRKNNGYFEYVQNYLNEVEQKIYK